MQKSLIAFLVLSALAQGSDSNTITIHGTEFTTDSPGPRGIDTSKNWALSETYTWMTMFSADYGEVPTCNGFYLEAGSGLRIYNAGERVDDIAVSYLYLDEAIKIADNENLTGQQVDTPNLINWFHPENNKGNTITIQDGGWVDINANYGNLINLSAMTTGGGIYLNTGGYLDLTDNNNNDKAYTLDDDVIIYVTLTEDVTERTLLGGDLSGWGGKVHFTLEDDYAIYQNGELLESTGALQGLVIDISADTSAISYKIGTSSTVPEPTTATLSLLALAGLAARRRRK